MFAKDRISRLFSSRSLCAAIGLVLSYTSIAGRVDAATVTWTTPAAITSNLVIVNPGNVVEARDFAPNLATGATTNVAVGADTVAFIHVGQQSFDFGGSSLGYFDTTEQPLVGSDFAGVLRRLGYSQTTETFQFGNVTPLTAGATYYLQAFSTEDRDSGPGGINPVGAPGYITRLGIGLSTVDLTIGQQLGGGEHSIATIVLGGAETSFNLDVTGVGEINLGLLSALILSQQEVANVPEPSTFVLAALGLVGLGFVALRRKFRRA